VIRQFDQRLERCLEAPGDPAFPDQVSLELGDDA
jgi:hypothetical protein